MDNISFDSIMGQCRLRVYNSLSRKKELFIPNNPKIVKWYICGPTVYDSAHMGHARTYISFDIMRRILEDYFGYNVFYCMNITDIDDKIIKRAREKYLIDQYIRTGTEDQIEKSIIAALKFHECRVKMEQDTQQKEMRERMLSSAKDAFKKRLVDKQGNQHAPICLDNYTSILSDWLDSVHGGDVTDHNIFTELSRRCETEFHKDLADLNVRPATVLTRVSEYIEEITQFVQLILKNDFAYVANESVYFDTQQFQRSAKHTYPRLLPEAKGDIRSIEEGEGALSAYAPKTLAEKKHPNDFVLWKKSKPGEPSWPSPWGQGRPGWHIECSAMACSILGQDMDIHSGGIDLKFPHHENEIAQTNAAYDSCEWIKYFWHSGHLTIQGCKMSKSLKNFITIRKSLEMYTHRQIRFLFLLHNWADTLDFSENAMRQALNYEKMCQEFFLTIKDAIRNEDPRKAESQRKWTSREFQLNKQFDAYKFSIHEALCDSFDTAAAMDSFRSLISSCYAYMNDRTHAPSNNIPLITNIALYIDKMFNVFGLMTERNEFGLATSETSLAAEGISNYENTVMPFVQSLVDFRDTVRSIALQHKVTALLDLCDTVRDQTLRGLGVKLEDKDNRTVIKLFDPKVLESESAKADGRSDFPKTDPINNTTGRVKPSRKLRNLIPPREMFLSETDKYSLFDERGFPTADNEGKPLTKSAIKKLMKVYELQEKRHLAFMKTKNGLRNGSDDSQDS